MNLYQRIQEIQLLKLKILISIVKSIVKKLVKIFQL